MKKILVFLLCFSFIIPSVYAYDFENPDNSSKVNDDITEINDLIEMYKEFVGDNDFAESDIDYEVANVDAYWWPIGCKDTTKVGDKLFATSEPETVVITSSFGATKDVSSHAKGHYGLDIGGGRKGETNIIAAKGGVVVYPTDKDKIDCPDGELGSRCGNGWGNYVIIQHSDGNYTLYGHMYENSITVKAGDTVDQGQVIGKMGMSGDSNGPHLHLEVRLGENTISACVDPLDYISSDNPRPSGSTGNFDDLKTFIETWEGVGCGESYQTDTEYIACIGSDSVITIGHGVTWEYNTDKFKAYGINSMSDGTRVSKKIVDAIEDEIINDNIASIRNSLANSGIDGLTDYQLAALVSRSYQGIAWVISNSNYPNFVDAYLKYNGQYKLEDMYTSTPNIWNDAMKRPNYTNTPGDSWGLYRRRASEWKLFTTGEIDYYPLEYFDPSKFSW